MTRRQHLALPTLILLALAAMVLGTASAPPANAAGASLVPGQDVLWGAFTQTQGQDAETALSAMEARLGRKLDLHRVYRLWDEPQPDSVVVTDLRRGRIPVLSIRPQLRNGWPVSWAAVARGDQDDVIVKQADGLRSLPGRLFLAFHHEPDAAAAAGYGTPTDFVAAWRHYRQVFASRGVTNVVFVWIMTPSSFRTPGLADSYYPGDDVVDWVAEDAYNWYACGPGLPTAWRTPADLVAPLDSWDRPHAKPLMLAEWGSVEDPAQPGRKAQFIRDMAAAPATWPNLEAMSYFDTVGTCSWRLDSSTSSIQAFADSSSAPAAHGRASAYLAPSTLLGPAPLTVRLDASKSTGTGAATGAGIASWRLDFGDGSPAASGTGQPPASLAHTYPAGTFSARLRVVDSKGDVNQDERAIVSAAAPTVTGKVSEVTATSANVRAWVAPNGLAATAHVEWGATTGYGEQSATAQVAGTTGTTALVFPLSGLTPGTRYYLRVVATSAAGTTVLSRTFDTPGAPTLVAQPAGWVTGTQADLNGQVNPHGLTTTYHYEWGRSTGYGSRTGSTTLDPVTWYKWASVTLTGLQRHCTYHYRLVAVNAAGTARGADQVLTTT